MTKYKNGGVLLLCMGMVALAFLLRPQVQAQPPGVGGGAAKRAPVSVEIAPVIRRDLHESRTLTGTAYPLQNITLATQSAGRLLELRVDIGSRVLSGQLLARMEDQELQQQLRQLEAQLRVTQAQQQELHVNFNNAEQELNRDATLLSRKLLTQSEWDQSKTSFDTARARLGVSAAQIQAQREAIKLAQIRRDETQIIARWPGRHAMFVAKRLADPGATLSANTPLLELVQINPLKIKVAVTEQDSVKVRQGQAVKLQSDAWPNEVFAGQIARVAPTISVDTRTAELEIHVNNDLEKLKPGMFLRAELILGTRPQAQAIPQDALVDREDLAMGVFLLEANRKTVRFVPVQVGIQTEGWVEILSPELQGDVVTLGNHLLKDKAEIRIAEGAKKPNTQAQKQPAAETAQ